ncbi:putative calcium-binding protein CML25 [Cinnamomum micranthum f. kanehirae]|uniref:Putative calcium-binding protein CML25 n=1 Tax=Cinnamomum micranthum f. kanehirae TaxID=337451 RepID=A0A3S3N8X0_9MAGN|nr:putative calcium-binding protein CML25 [Cinnamomum micranthum f. kanehirae]
MGKNFFNLYKKESSKEISKSPHSSAPSSSHESPPSSSSSLLQIQDPDDLRSVFNKFDANGDGKISSSELESMLNCFGNLGSAQEAESMMQAADLDGDGYISLEEFLSVNTMEMDSGSCMEDLRSAFEVFDQDRNGLISAEELQHVLGAMGEKASLGDCRMMINGVDRNGDGAVNFEEFIKMMTRSRA